MAKTPQVLMIQLTMSRFDPVMSFWPFFEFDEVDQWRHLCQFIYLHINQTGKLKGMDCNEYEAGG